MKSSFIWLSKIDEFARQGSKVTLNNLKNSIIEKGISNFFFFTQKIYGLTFSTLRRFGFGTAVGL